ncbi:TIGR03067 domain-containing protein [Fimbriiglobus ruber]|uniref:TIGR03067 domain-containing protein n=1 Tax=Fimbriiglobus ruber TaxID=1908690 RepID=UPI000B4BF154|nr:TIGR03067 domain-containing protein [Fimbriiglobus ruber]
MFPGPNAKNPGISQHQRDFTHAVVKEFQSLRGTWVLTSAEKSGKKITTEELFLASAVQFQFTDSTRADTSKRCDIYNIEFDPVSNPKRLLAAVTGGEIKGQKMLCIYSLKNDTLTIHISHNQKKYPVDFSTRENDGYVLLTLIRQK